MDVEGIDAAVLYPSFGLWVPFQPELGARGSARACDLYNEWVADYCSAAPDRLAAVALVPMADPRAAVHAARRAADLDLVGVLLRPNFLHGRNLGDRAYDPLYQTLAEAGLAVAVHEGLGLRGAPTMGSERFAGYVLRHACSHPMEQMSALGSLVVDGALERHPDLRVGFLESGTGWLPFWLARLADHLELVRDADGWHLPLTPAEYFARQCVICADPDDELVGDAVAHVGADHVMMASDFPHPESRYPEAVRTFLSTARDCGLGPGAVDAMLWATRRTSTECGSGSRSRRQARRSRPRRYRPRSTASPSPSASTTVRAAPGRSACAAGRTASWSSTARGRRCGHDRAARRAGAHPVRRRRPGTCARGVRGRQAPRRGRRDAPAGAARGPRRGRGRAAGAARAARGARRRCSPLIK